MLTARPLSLTSWSFVVEDGRQPVARVDLKRLRDDGMIHVGSVPFDLEASGFVSREITLSFEGLAVAEARSRPLTRQIDVTVEAGLLGTDTPLVLALQPSWSMRTFRVKANDRDVGTIRRRGFWGRRLELDLSDALPLGVQAFLLGLVVIQWRRASRSG